MSLFVKICKLILSILGSKQNMSKENNTEDNRGNLGLISHFLQVP